jgi:hypothetical protein
MTQKCSFVRQWDPIYLKTPFENLAKEDNSRRAPSYLGAQGSGPRTESLAGRTECRSCIHRQTQSYVVHKCTSIPALLQKRTEYLLLLQILPVAAHNIEPILLPESYHVL